jgi:hypothetical protein
MTAILITGIILAVIIAGIVFFSGRSLQTAGHIAHLLEGLAVTGALIFAGLEYWQHQSAEEAKLREAPTAILQKAFNPGDVDAAYGKLYRKYDGRCIGPTCGNEFDEDTGTLISYYWSVEACLRAEICEKMATEKAFCGDFKKYYDKYAEIHGPKEATARFDGWNNLLKCPSEQPGKKAS